MNELLQSGQHPDADQLSAFAEHALPPHERQQTLAHLAVCAHCRGIVSLSLPPTEELPRLQPAPARRPWFSGWNLAWPVAVAFAAMTLVVIHVNRASRTLTEPTPPTQIAVSHPPEAPAPPAPQPTPSAAPMPARNVVAKPAIPAGAIAMAAGAAPGAPALAAGLANQPSPSGSAGLARITVNGQAGQLAGLALANVLNGGDIQGTVTDPDGRAVAGADIVATNTDTGAQVKARTGSGGTYSIHPLQPGPYIVEVVAKGFERLLQENLAVNNASTVGLNLRMRPGGENTTVTITDAPPNLNTTDAALGGTIENELYANLPLAMNSAPRDPTAFQYIMPGAQQSPASNTNQGTTAGLSGIYGGTGQTNLNQNYVEGMPVPNIAAQGSGAAVATTVSVDAVDQASVQSAAIANASGAAISPNASLALNQARAITLQHPLPSGLPALSAVAAGHQQLAIDAANKLFLSNDDGLKWKAIPAQWKGRVVKLNPAVSPAPAPLPQATSAAKQVSPSPAPAPPPPAAAAPASSAQTASAAKPPVAAQALSLKKNLPAASQLGGFPTHFLYEVTTDKGEHWVSSDGLDWIQETPGPSNNPN
jgi:hypothetical protein